MLVLLEALNELYEWGKLLSLYMGSHVHGGWLVSPTPFCCHLLLLSIIAVASFFCLEL